MLKPIQLISARPNIAFMRWRRLFFAFSGALMLGSVLLYGIVGLNLGIDFKGGILIELRTPQAADIGDLRRTLSGLDLGEVALQGFGQPTDVLIHIQKQEGDEKAQIAAVEKIKAALGDEVEYRRTEFVGPKVGAELIEAGVMAVVFAMLAIMVYVWFRFEWQFGVGAVLALAHDVISTVGVFALLQIEFNLTTIAAILTIAGYSINDTVVIFDRVRENLRKYKRMALPELLNLSVNETLSRTVMTGLTTLLALIALFFFGGEVIRGFSFAMIWGVVIGTYSSVCIAVPLLLVTGLKRGGEAGAADAPAGDAA